MLDFGIFNFVIFSMECTCMAPPLLSYGASIVARALREMRDC